MFVLSARIASRLAKRDRQLRWLDDHFHDVGADAIPLIFKRGMGDSSICQPCLDRNDDGPFDVLGRDAWNTASLSFPALRDDPGLIIAVSGWPLVDGDRCHPVAAIIEDEPHKHGVRLLIGPGFA